MEGKVVDLADGLSGFAEGVFVGDFEGTLVAAEYVIGIEHSGYTGWEHCLKLLLLHFAPISQQIE